MDWVKLTRESMATTEDWERVIKITSPNELGEVYLTPVKDEISTDDLLKKYRLDLRGKAQGRWSAYTYIIVWDKRSKKYLPLPGTRGYLEFDSVEDAIKYLKNNYGG